MAHGRNHQLVQKGQPLPVVPPGRLNGAESSWQPWPLLAVAQTATVGKRFLDGVAREEETAAGHDLSAVSATAGGWHSGRSWRWAAHAAAGL